MTVDPSVAAARAFFAPRAASWDVRFPDDGPAFEQAVAELGLRAGDAVLDAGCGTGRAFDALRARVGPSGSVVGIDVTPEMLEVASAPSCRLSVPIVFGDARRLPFRVGRFDAVFAAGLLAHLPDAEAGLAELARVVAAGGGLALFHPVGRAVLAARHRRALDPGDTLDPAVLPRVLQRSGWLVTAIEDGADRYLALASRADGDS